MQTVQIFILICVFTFCIMCVLKRLVKMSLYEIIKYILSYATADQPHAVLPRCVATAWNTLRPEELCVLIPLLDFNVW